VFEKRVLRRIPKKDEVTGGQRNLHDEELRDLYSSPSIIRLMKLRRMRWAGHVEQMEEKRNACRFLIGKPEGSRPLGRPRHKQMENVKAETRERENGVVWTGLVWFRIRAGGELM
jgi:hypothetical protein